MLSNDPVVHNEEQGRRWLKTAAANGNSAAQYMLGKMYLQEGQKELAMTYFSMAAEQGSSYAQFFLDRRDQLHHPSAMLAVTRLFRSLSQMFQDNAQKQVSPGIHIDRKRRHELLKKREALGIRGPIQDESYGYSQSM